MANEKLGTVGDRIRHAMERKRIQNQAVADVAGVHVKTVSAWLNGRGNPHDNQLIKISALLNVSPAWLRYGQSPPDEAAMVDYSAPGARIPQPPYRQLDLPKSVRLWIKEFEVELVKDGATDEQIAEARALMHSPEVFTYFSGGNPANFSEAEIIEGLESLATVIRARLAKLRKRARKAG